MATLGARDRARLPDRAFAYIDSAGRRLLPINDAAHVRAALARFGQVDFEDDAARDLARLRLLRAARREGVAPVGFLTRQLEPHRALPRGNVTFLMCDLEGSTQLLAALGDEYGAVRAELRRLVRGAVRRANGREVDARADEYFAVFPAASGALVGALEAQRAIGEYTWREGIAPRLRMGLHSGRPTLTASGYIGLSVHTVARVCAVGHGGQVLLTQATVRSVGAALPAGIEMISLGEFRLAGLPEAMELIQATPTGGLRDFPPLRVG
jgi:class 3 adenylate cyclase